MNDDHFTSNLERTELARILHLGQKVRPIFSAGRVAVMLLLTLVFYQDYWKPFYSLVTTYFDYPLPNLDAYPGPRGWDNVSYLVIPGIWIYVVGTTVHIADGILRVRILGQVFQKALLGDVVALCWWRFIPIGENQPELNLPGWVRRFNVETMFLFRRESEFIPSRWQGIWMIGWRKCVREMIREEIIRQCGLVYVPGKTEETTGLLYRKPNDTSELPLPPLIAKRNIL